MKVDEFLNLMQKVMKFKNKLEKEGILGLNQEVVIKVYINDLTPRINTSMLKGGVDYDI